MAKPRLSHARALPAHAPGGSPLRRLLRCNLGTNLKALLAVFVELRVNPWLAFYRTSKLTTAPANTFCPAIGVCDTMTLAGEACAGGAGCSSGASGDAGALVAFAFVASPAGGLDGATTLTFPNLNPASCKVRLTLPSACPTKLGITKACGSASVVSSKLIFGATTCVAFAVGLCART